jgi:hypothetical protein
MTSTCDLAFWVYFVPQTIGWTVILILLVVDDYLARRR